MERDCLKSSPSLSGNWRLLNTDKSMGDGALNSDLEALLLIVIESMGDGGLVNNGLRLVRECGFGLEQFLLMTMNPS